MLVGLLAVEELEEGDKKSRGNVPYETVESKNAVLEKGKSRSESKPD